MEASGDHVRACSDAWTAALKVEHLGQPENFNLKKMALRLGKGTLC
jgi:hypothetical protein